MVIDQRGLLDLLVLFIGQELLTVHAQVSITARQSIARVKEGSSFTFIWDYQLGSIENLRDIVFGVWEKGYTSTYFMTVTRNKGAVQNPDLAKTHPDLIGRIRWAGDISRYAAFTLSNIMLSDNKTYGCQLGIGGFGQTKDSKITLIVEKAVLSKFLLVPEVKVALEGQEIVLRWEFRLTDVDNEDIETVQLSRKSTQASQPLVLWKVEKNVEKTIAEYTNRLSVKSRNKGDDNLICSYTFKLSNVTFKDEGEYQLKVEFAHEKRPLKSEVSLDVYGRPKITGYENEKGIYKEGEMLLLACDDVEGKPSKLRWMRDGNVIPHKTQGYFLKVKKLSRSDEGAYVCCAEYPLGNVSSLEVRIKVQYAPSIYFPSDTQTVLSWKGHPTTLNCSAEGFPPAMFSWTRADEKRLYGETADNTGILTITPSLDFHFTNYTCIARNTIGEDRRMFILKPIRPPTPPVITNVRVNHNALKVTWKLPSSKQNTPITGHVMRIRKESAGPNIWNEIHFSKQSNYFIVRNLTARTNYSLWLFATNVAGRSNASAVKHVKTLQKGFPGSPSLHFENVKINHSFYNVTWDYPRDVGGDDVTLFTLWYREIATNNSTQGKWRNLNTTKTRFHLNLNCCLTYEVTVTAWNRYGHSFFDPNNEARITVLRDLPTNTTVTSTGSEDSCDTCIAKKSTKNRNSERRPVLKFLQYTAILLIPLIVVLTRLLVRSLRTCKIKPIHEVKIDGVEEPADELQILEAAPGPHLPLWEFPRGNLAVERVIGNGAFGVVSKAYARYLPGHEEWTTVAVKSLQDGSAESERRDLLSELNLLKKLKPHPHIIRLLGCVTTDQERPLVIIEYVPYGDLLGYLRRSRGVSDCYYDNPDIKPMTSLTSEEMLKFAWQISDGMRYISFKKIVHRDLAARNVLVGENFTCKITDFGMARDVNLEEIYVPRNEGRIPVKWTAIEAMTGAMKYTSQSDVWSFGVVLFEICTIGAEPYPGISPFKLPSVLLKGYRIPKPEYVKDELYDIMRECWETEPDNRPSFDKLCQKIRLLGARANQNYVNIKDCLEAYEQNEIAS
ncbi:unnamed protein product [Porites evermanni]|uniref:receptor protein-tyrosine kinase n=1 Tax=Porites evermanni TaxID=104178 RepID=A0ABN8MP03_9CNID|nr:unnamed protein product [Porites evermanni]